MSHRGVCPKCAKKYRVPHDRREWRCKECDVALELEPREPDGRACPACGVEVGENDRYCEECGARLAPGEDAAGDDAHAPGEKRAAASEMRKAEQRVRLIRAVFVANLLLLGFTFVLLFFADEVPLVPVVLVGAILALCLFGLTQLRRRPFPVTLALALLDTLALVLGLLQGQVSFLAILKTAGFWVITYQAARLTALAREFPELYAAKRMRGEHLTHERGRPGALSRKHRGTGRARRDWKALAMTAVVAVVLVAGGTFYFAEEGPPDPGPSLERFRVAWNEGHVGELAGFSRSENQAKRERSFSNALESYEWGARFPNAETVSWEERDGSTIEVLLHTIAGDAPMRFQWERDRWVMTSLSFSGVKDWRP